VQRRVRRVRVQRGVPVRQGVLLQREAPVQ